MHSIKLRDGRKLAYTWFGAPPPAATAAAPVAARPAADESAHPTAPSASPSPPAVHHTSAASQPNVLLHFHGFCSSRLEGGLLHQDATHHGLAVLSVDRPGHGGSTHNPQQTVASVAEDAIELLDRLQLETVIIQGVSGGSPYACAAAAALGERCRALLLVCPLMPTSGQEGQLLEGTSPSTLRLFHSVRDHPWRLWATLHGARLLQRIPHGNLLLSASGFADVDKQAMTERPDLGGVLKAGVREGLTQGVAAAMQDLQVFYVDPASVDLSGIHCKTVHVWQGGQDATTPPAMARAYAESMPHAQLHLLEAEGHLSLPFRHNRQILGSAIGA